MKRVTWLAMLLFLVRWAARAQSGSSREVGNSAISPALTVTKVDHWVIHDSHPWDDGERCKKIMASPGGNPGDHARLLQANIEREISRESLDLRRFHLSPKEPIDLAAQQTTPFRLCLDHRFLWPG